MHLKNHNSTPSPLKVQGSFQKREEKDRKSPRKWMSSQCFPNTIGNYTYEFTIAVMTSTRAMQIQARQTPSMGVGSGYKAPRFL